MTRKVYQGPICFGLTSVVGLFFALMATTSMGQTAEAFYASDVDSIVQGKCIACHRSGGQAGGTALRFTSSVSGNHTVFESYVSSQARADRVLSKIRGGAGHGGGVQVSSGSPDYQKFEQYMQYLTDTGSDVTVPSPPRNVSAEAGDKNASVSFSPPEDDGGSAITQYAATSNPGGFSVTCSASPCVVEGLTNGTAYVFTVTATNEAGVSAASSPSNSATPTAPNVKRVALEEPVASEIHMGIGNIRGWAVASDGITKVEIWIDGAYAFDAPYGGERTDVGSAFPDIDGSVSSGFAAAFAYSNLSVGSHSITAVAYTGSGETKESTKQFEVVGFPNPYIAASGAVDLDAASCSVSSDEISLVDALVEGDVYDLTLKWRTAEQGFEIIEIR